METTGLKNIKQVVIALDCHLHLLAAVGVDAAAVVVIATRYKDTMTEDSFYFSYPDYHSFLIVKGATDVSNLFCFYTTSLNILSIFDFLKF